MDNQDIKLKIPNHVAIIMDGNGRWAQNKGLTRSMGHKAGAENFKKLSKYILQKGVKILSVYAFSTENFKRSKEEVDYLMKLFVDNFKKEIKTFQKENIKVVFSGRRKQLSEKVLKVIDDLTEKTKNNSIGTLNICMNYGGHAEIIDATKKILNDVNNNLLTEKEINEEIFNKYLYNELPPIDFLIRTSGEERVSNFMLWQLAYAEFYFPNVHFPDFDSKEFDKAILSYNNRDRRFGGVKK